jgi:hypothetical protein
MEVETWEQKRLNLLTIGGWRTVIRKPWVCNSIARFHCNNRGSNGYFEYGWWNRTDHSSDSANSQLLRSRTQATSSLSHLFVSGRRLSRTCCLQRTLQLWATRPNDDPFAVYRFPGGWWDPDTGYRFKRESIEQPGRTLDRKAEMGFCIYLSFRCGNSNLGRRYREVQPTLITWRQRRVAHSNVIKKLPGWPTLCELCADSSKCDGMQMAKPGGAFQSSRHTQRSERPTLCQRQNRKG